MGKITSLIEFKGAVGNLVGYKGKDGRNVIRKRTWDVRNAKSVLQMRRRVQWANLVNVWKAIAPYMEPSFENKTAGQSDYNAYVQANVDNGTCVYLTKQDSRQGVTVVAPYILCRGTLPEIPLNLVSGGKMKSDIAVGDLTLNAETTRGNLSKAILDNNSGYQNGDQLAYVVVQQIAVGTEGIPRVEVKAGRFIIDQNATDDIFDTISINDLGTTDGYLASKASVNGGMVFIHSRKVEGKTLVSNAQLTVNNNLLSSYTSGTAQANAMQSYGVKDENYLTPTGDQYLPSTPGGGGF